METNNWKLIIKKLAYFYVGIFYLVLLIGTDIPNSFKICIAFFIGYYWNVLNNRDVFLLLNIIILNILLNLLHNNLPLSLAILLITFAEILASNIGNFKVQLSNYT